MSELKDWSTCELWKTLELRTTHHAEECRTTLRSVMPMIQDVLNSGGTSPKDFTLHDAGHSFRVAERIQGITNEITGNLTVFELSLLLLSAYLHDIGMTPKFKKVDAVFSFLLTGEGHTLASTEVAELQTWLDDKGYAVVPPITEALPLTDRLMLAREIATYFCRYRHNDWSAEWIRGNLANRSLSNYFGWVDDLILVCQSHHFGFDRLTQQSFRPRRVASPSEVVNLRFLALVLRMADILDFDPERTPDIILRHRDIAPESQIYWWKDKELALKLTTREIVITARPSSAHMHKAIEETMDAIDAEMALCKRIADDFPLGAIPGEAEIPYPWTLPAACHRDIEPREGTYEYINGAFRPDTKKLLSLLSGTSLYQTPFHAVRELVQNAFDAVVEKIAYMRLLGDPGSTRLAKQLAEQHRVSLQLETEGGDSYLVCTDNGIGMTKTIIRDRVLVTGSSPRHDVRALDRRCKEAGFDLERSGQFGIGILSYFMIATNVEVETQRAQESGDADSTKWHFETGGVGSFGELRRVGGNLAGTRVRLRLNLEISSDLKAWYRKLRRYLERTLVHCPCEFHFSSPLPECLPLELKPGWAPRDDSSRVTEELRRRRSVHGADNPHILSSAERERRFAADREIADLEREISSHLFWRSEEGVFVDGSGRFEIRIPYFRLWSDTSLAFCRIEVENNGKLPLGRFMKGTHLVPQGGLEEGWKGMAVGRLDRADRFGQNITNPPGSFVRINWTSSKAGEIMASRDEFVGKTYASAQAEIEDRWETMLRGFLEENKDSQFAWLNERIAGLPSNKAKSCRWICESDRGKKDRLSTLFWGDIKFPAISRASFGYAKPDRSRNELEFNTKLIHVIPCSIPAPDLASVELGAVGWNSELMAPDRVVFLKTWWFGMAPIWLRRPRAGVVRSMLKSKFPPQWAELCGARFDWYAGKDKAATVWNCNHPLVKQVIPSAWTWCEQTFGKSIDPMPHRDKLIEDPAKGAAWLLQCIGRDSHEVWEGLPERDSRYLPELLGILFPRKRRIGEWRILLWIQSDVPSGSRLRVVDIKRWTVVDYKAVEQYLPEPLAAWSINLGESVSKISSRRTRASGTTQ